MAIGHLNDSGDLKLQICYKLKISSNVSNLKAKFFFTFRIFKSTVIFSLSVSFPSVSNASVHSLSYNTENSSASLVGLLGSLRSALFGLL